MPGELISREALERIIQRAAELQAAEHDIGEGLTKAELLALGQDVGIPERYLHQALLEEQTRAVVEQGRGALAWLAGPTPLSAARGAPGGRAAPPAALGATVPIALISPILFVKGAALGIAAILVARRHRPQNERIQVGLEQVLDRLERGEIRPEHALPGQKASAFVRIADEIRMLMNPGTPPRG